MTYIKKHLPFVLLVGLLFIGALSLQWARAQVASTTFTVVNTADQDLSGFTVAGSLRAAIEGANGAATPDVIIKFSIPGAAGGVQTITLNAPLPPITHAVTIDGTTQPGFGAPGVPRIELDGTTAGGTGLTVTAANVIIRSLTINRFADGISISGPGTDFVQGCYIGLNAAGTAKSPNTNNGINVGAPNVTINAFNFVIPGGPTIVLRNVISGNGQRGIGFSAAASNLKVQGNYIGPDATGTGLVDSNVGIYGTGAIAGTGVTIGGTTAAQRNVISGHIATVAGISGAGIYLQNTSGPTTTIEGNYIGTDAAGTASVVNSNGIVLNNTNNVTIGGTTAAARNIISGNSNNGIFAFGPSTINTKIQGNYIGPDVNGAAAPTSGGAAQSVGIQFNQFPANSNTVIGSLATDTPTFFASQANVIAFNSGTGVSISSGGLVPPGNGIIIRANSIFSNGSLGINIVGGSESNGVTLNDLKDVDTGANDVQNYPVITDAYISGRTTVVTGILNSIPSSTFTVDLYRSPAAGVRGFGEGQTYFGTASVTTDANGNGAFTVSSVGNFTGQAIAGTATEANNSTSEFSKAVTVRVPVAPTITSIAPTSGPRGTIVTITGTDLNGATAVSFGTSATTVYTVNSATEIVATAPSGATTGPITVTTPGGTAVSRQTFTVTAGYVVTNINDTGSGSLRDAITYANTTTGITISFKIPNTGAPVVHTITPASVLPDITAPVTIDGYTQDGSHANTLATGNDAALTIQLTGVPAIAGAGLTVKAANCTIQGLAINGFSRLSGGLGDGSVEFTGAAVTSGVLQGCFLGTNVSGTAAAPSLYGALVIEGANHVSIGGTTPAARNVISGNTYGVGIGVGVTDNGLSNNNVVQGNYIGTDKSGTAAIANTYGVFLMRGTKSNIIGSITPGAGNVIAFNTNDGVVVSGGGATPVNNSIRGNSIYSNGSIGIDLSVPFGGDGVTRNDTGTGDADAGPNNLQNYPALTGVTSAGGNTSVTGTLDSTPGQTFTIDFYRNVTADPTGFGEGQVYLGSLTNVSTDSISGISPTFTFNTIGTFPGQSISAVAVAANGDTSEFSEVALAPSAAGPAITSISPTSGPRGTIVTITGTNLSGATAVNFTPTPGQTAPATINPGNSATQIVVTVPSGAATGPIRVTTPGGIATSAIFTVTAGYVVTNTNNSGSGSLFDAITYANSNADLTAISFKISGAGPFSIKPGNPNPIVNLLPPISQPATIDGYTQSSPGSTHLIEISGENVVGSTYGLDVTGGGTTIRGLVINRFGGGIRLHTKGGNTVTGNFIGTNTAGTTPLANDYGISVEGVANNTIGGTNAADRNVISGNRLRGISATAGVTALTIVNNYVGINAAGARLGNDIGIYIDNSSTVTVGGPTAQQRNIVSGNTGDGISLNAASSNTVQDNYIGVGADGTTDIGNGGAGISQLGGTNNKFGTVGAGNVISGNGGDGINSRFAVNTGGSNTITGNIIGLDAAGVNTVKNDAAGIDLVFSNTTVIAGNRIAGNTGDGVSIAGNGTPTTISTNNSLIGNFIGLNVNNVARPNSNGVHFSGYDANNTVGGLNATDRNVISGNTNAGILIDSNATTTTIQNNLIGLNALGTGPVANGLGMYINGTASNIVGGTTATARNIISGNTTGGITISGAAATNNFIQGNFVGLNLNGNASVPNAFGIQVFAGAKNNFIGTAGAGNVVSGNTTGGGIAVHDGGTTGNSIKSNFVGLDKNGQIAIPNRYGIDIFNGAASNTVGGTTAGDRNVVSGNAEAGIAVNDAGTTGNLVQGNYAGLNVTGVNAIPNGTGIAVFSGAKNNFIGTAGAGNVVSGNTNGGGINISDAGTTGNLVRSNYIGFKPDGSGALPNDYGIGVFNGATGNTIGGAAAGQGNVVSGNTQAGISINDAGTNGNFVIGNFVGTNPAGTAAIPNTRGVTIFNGAQGNTIGGLTAAERNICSGNIDGGIEISGTGTSGNKVIGNYAGLNGAGTAAIPNRFGIGVFFKATGNFIGGTALGARNIASGNTGAGISISDAGTTGNFVQSNFAGLNPNGDGGIANGTGIEVFAGATGNFIGTVGARNIVSGNTTGGGIAIHDAGTIGNIVKDNFVGLDKNGQTAIANRYGIGIYNGATGNTVGGAAAGERNVASGNTESGLSVNDSGTTGNTFQGNYAGVNITGTSSVPNGTGITIFNAAKSNTIGGTAAGAGNLFSGNNVAGILIGFAGTSSNLVQGNVIGLKADGTALGNGTSGPGVHISSGASGNTIGGSAAARNIISGNKGSGVLIDNANANTISGNYIGVGADGVTVRGNSGLNADGVTIDNNSDNNIIGVNANGVGVANIIANNAARGILVTSVGGSTGNRISRNSIYNNGNIGIDLNTEGITPNDPGDADTGANNLQNYPVITSVARGSLNTVISGSLNSAAGTYTIEFFSSPTTNPIKPGEGRIYRGSGQVTLTAAGAQPFTITVPVVIPANELVTATATDSANNTSEFSAASGAAPAPSLTVSVTPATFSEGAGANAAIATVTRSGSPASALTINVSSSDTTAAKVPPTVQTFAPGSPTLQFFVSAVDDAIIDGTQNVIIGATAPGFTAGTTIIQVVDNDSAGFIISPTTGLVTTEGHGTATFTVRLATQPSTGTVITLPLSSNNTAEGTVAPATLTFNSTNYATLQTVTITGVDDNFVDGDIPYTIITSAAIVTGAVTAGDNAYNGLNPVDVSVTNTDNDTAPVGQTGVLAWGYNTFGQLGDGTTAHKSTPEVVAGPAGIAGLAAGGGHSVVPQTAGTARSAGYNSSGQLGDGTTVDKATLVTVNGLTNVSSVVTGWYHTVALRSDGTVWAWGNNFYGQLGDGTTQNRVLPTQIKSLTSVIAVSAGVYHSLALRSDGTVWAWGNNFYGQLGNGTVSDSLVPVKVVGLSGVSAIAGGGAHSVALAGGAVWTWGWNDNGQLGDGTRAARALPVKVNNLSGVSAVAAGYSHTLALVGGTVRAWGNNTYGQLGNQSTADSAAPVTAIGLTDVRLIAAGSAHNLAVKNDGTLWVWGNNAYGSLGDGTTVNRMTPFRLTNIANVRMISAGYGHSLALGDILPPVPNPSPVGLSGASANLTAGTVTLSFAGALNAATASNVANYTVTSGGAGLTVRTAAYSAATNTVTLGVTGLQAGTNVTASWRGLLDSSNRALAPGSITVAVR